MKKIFIIFSLFLFFFAINTSAAIAGCTPKTADDNCAAKNPSEVNCDVSRRAPQLLMCCSTPRECQQLAIPSPLVPSPLVPSPNLNQPNNPCGDKAVPTALGCIDVTDTSAFTASILKLGIGIGGGIAFILMLAAVFMIMTSAGDPKRMQAGQELITSALMGLLLIIFSVFLLHFIGVDILGIPGFSK